MVSEEEEGGPGGGRRVSLVVVRSWGWEVVGEPSATRLANASTARWDVNIIPPYVPSSPLSFIRRERSNWRTVSRPGSRSLCSRTGTKVGARSWPASLVAEKNSSYPSWGVDFVLRRNMGIDPVSGDVVVMVGLRHCGSSQPEVIVGRQVMEGIIGDKKFGRKVPPCFCITNLDGLVSANAFVLVRLLLL